MSREVRRVPLDFDWPIGKVWGGYETPDRFSENPCPDCTQGYAPRAQHLLDQWYGNAPFTPESNGSTPFTHESPAVRAFAERQIARSPGYYGTGEAAIVREGRRLADLFNGQWSHHLNQDDVDAFIAADRLWGFTSIFVPGEGWRKVDPPVVPTAAQVNEWHINSMGHDDLNASYAVSARCARDGIIETCPTCDGHASLEAYEGQRAEAAAWEYAEPPTGDGWQLWTTVTSGSPKSPVFADADALAAWMSSPAYKAIGGPLTFAQARAFVDVGHSFGSGTISPDGVVTSNEHAVADPDGVLR